MATTPTKPAIEVGSGLAAAQVPSWPPERGVFAPGQATSFEKPLREVAAYETHGTRDPRPSGRDALQALLAFSALHQQVRRRRALAAHREGFEPIAPATELEAQEQFVLDEVLQLVAQRAI